MALMCTDCKISIEKLNSPIPALDVIHFPVINSHPTHKIDHSLVLYQDSNSAAATPDPTIEKLTTMQDTLQNRIASLEEEMRERFCGIEQTLGRIITAMQILDNQGSNR